jgi:hypothetical protein
MQEEKRVAVLPRLKQMDARTVSYEAVVSH